MEKKPKANKKSSDKPCSSKDARIKLLVAEKVLLKRWVNDLQSGMYINCVYCGHRYGPREGTPVSMADVLKEHIETCPEHPMYKLKERVTELEAENTALRCKPVITEYSELDVRWQEHDASESPEPNLHGSEMYRKGYVQDIEHEVDLLRAKLAELEKEVENQSSNLNMCHHEIDVLVADLKAASARIAELEAENIALRCKPVITEYSELDVRWQELVAEWNKARIKLYNLRTEIESSLPLILTQEQIERFELISQAPCEASALDIQYMAALLLRQIKGKSE